jgi:hypothetical protein
VAVDPVLLITVLMTHHLTVSLVMTVAVVGPATTRPSTCSFVAMSEKRIVEHGTKQDSTKDCLLKLHYKMSLSLPYVRLETKSAVASHEQQEGFSILDGTVKVMLECINKNLWDHLAELGRQCCDSQTGFDSIYCSIIRTFLVAERKLVDSNLPLSYPVSLL